MELKKTNCTECGSPIAISDDVQYINCTACGSFFAVERGEGYIGLKAVEKLTKAIQDTGIGTQDVIREGTQVTRAELQRLQVTQGIAMAEMKLGNLQAEIRGLEREQPTPKSLQQIRSLYGIEYNSLEELRRMHLNAAALGPQDLNSRIKNAEFNLNWLNNQKRVLSQSDFSNAQKKQTSSDLDMRIGQVSKELFTLRTELIKANLQTFKTTTLPLDDLAQAQIFVQQLNNDEAIVRRMPSTPETQAVLKEISDRKKKVTDAWIQLENKRVSGKLTSPGVAVNQNELASLKNHLALVNGDLNTVRQMPLNSVTKEYVNRLIQEQAALTKQISRLEQDLQKVQEQARKNALKAGGTVQSQPAGSGAVKTGVFAGLLLAVTGMFAGIAALGKEIAGSFSTSKQPSNETSTSFRTAAVQPGELAQPPQTESLTTVSDFTIGAVPPRQPSGLEFGSLAKGCSLGLLLTIGFLCIGFVIFGVAFPNSTGTTSYVGTGLFIFAIGIGFALGCWVFLRNVAPLTRIKGAGPFKGVVINKHPKKPGLSNPLAVKGLVGVLTCLVTYLIFMSIIMMLPPEAGFVGFCIGILLGPILGGLFSYRTYLAELQA